MYKIMTKTTKYIMLHIKTIIKIDKIIAKMHIN